MPKKTSKRIAQLEAALRHIAAQTKGYVPDSAMGGIHECATLVLTEKASMLAVRVVNTAAVAGLDYGTIYSGCPPQFFRRSWAEDWAMRLDCATSWPNGNPRYKVVEIDGSIPVDVLTGHPT